MLFGVLRQESLQLTFVLRTTTHEFCPGRSRFRIGCVFRAENNFLFVAFGDVAELTAISSGQIAQTTVRNTIGGFTSSRNSYSLGTSLVLLPHLVGSADEVLRAASSWPTIVENTELIVAFGGIPAKNVFVTPGGVTRHGTPGYLAALAARRVEMALVSPLRDDLPAGVDTRWYPIVPATDAALMLGLAHTLVTEGRHDRAFLDRYTVGFGEVENYLLGRADGVVRDAAWAAPTAAMACSKSAAMLASPNAPATVTAPAAKTPIPTPSALKEALTEPAPTFSSRLMYERSTFLIPADARSRVVKVKPKPIEPALRLIAYLVCAAFLRARVSRARWVSMRSSSQSRSSSVISSASAQGTAAPEPPCWCHTSWKSPSRQASRSTWGKRR